MSEPVNSSTTDLEDKWNTNGLSVYDRLDRLESFAKGDYPPKEEVEEQPENVPVQDSPQVQESPNPTPNGVEPVDGNPTPSEQSTVTNS